MRDDPFKSWENIVSRFQTPPPPPKKKEQVGDTRKCIYIIDEKYS